MKKSQLYYEMQHVVLNSAKEMMNSTKLEMLRELMAQEDLAKYSEEHEANKE